MISVPLREYTKEDLEGDQVLLPPGKYHVQITNAREKDEATPYLDVAYRVLAGEHPAAVGSGGHEKFFLSVAAKKRLAILLKRLGHLDRADFSAEFSFDESDLIGQELVVEVVHDQGETKKGEKFTRSVWSFAGMWAVDDERVAGVPKARRPGGPRPAVAAAVSQADLEGL